MYRIDDKTIANDININSNTDNELAARVLLGINLKLFEYLLSNNPDEVMSKYGYNIRKFISPAFRKLVPLFAKTKLNIVRKEEAPKDEPVIYAATHGFRDDIPQTIHTIDRHAYLLFASLPSFFSTINGASLWTNGTILFNRKDKESSKSVIPKACKIIRMGSSIIIYPEGVWNKTENKLVQKLYPGTYRIACETGVLVVPVATIQEGKQVYSIQEKAFDITQYGEKPGLEVLREKLASAKYEMMLEHSQAKRSDFGDEEATKQYWNSYLDELVKSADGFYDPEIENSAEYIDKTQKTMEEVFALIDQVIPTLQNARAIIKRKEYY